MSLSRNSQTLAYFAAGATTAAIAAYILGPTIFQTAGNDACRARGVIGLSNPGNDCFINSTLQAFAGLPKFRLFLNELETIHSKDQRHNSDQPSTPDSLISTELEQIVVSRSLLALIQVLADAPINKRSTSAKAFLRSLEHVFDARISRQQQDAQEFLQIVLDRLADESNALLSPVPSSLAHCQTIDERSDCTSRDFGENAPPRNELPHRIPTFPFTGRLETMIQCQICQHKPKPAVSTFVTLTLNVPHTSSTSIDACLDGLMKVETIDDYKCDRCCIKFALDLERRRLDKQYPSGYDCKDGEALAQLQEALDGELHDIDSLNLPPAKNLPKSRITKYSTISSHPSILVLHLSRSIFDATSLSRKNDASVLYPETLLMGGFNKQTYKLKCLVTHKGGHNSGHYETFTLRYPTTELINDALTPSSKPTQKSHVSKNFLASETGMATTNKGDAFDQSEKNQLKKADKRTKPKWWRISDDKVSETSARQMLAMNKEAYLLFYELQDEKLSGLETQA